MIYFNLPKLKRNLGQTYFLRDAQSISDETRHWHIGDEVRIMLPITDEQRLAMEAQSFGDFRTGGEHAHVPCRVVRRIHTAAWKEVGIFQTLGMSVELEPMNKKWEEAVLWIAAGVEPGWA